MQVYLVVCPHPKGRHLGTEYVFVDSAWESAALAKARAAQRTAEGERAEVRACGPYEVLTGAGV
jgi:hypothetical protein